jgi:hypothetical protein
MGLEPTTFCMASEREPLRLVAPARNKAESGAQASINVAAGFARWLTSC